jgi:hypothetical protein
MRRFWHENNTIKEEKGELKKNLAELECEEAIMEDKNQFGRVRNSMMKVLRAKYSDEIANRVLSRVNKRIQGNHFNQKSLI